MDATSHLLLDLLIVFVAARVAGELFERLHLPAVVGEILAGVLVGPSLLGIAHESVGLSTVATLGVVVLQFVVGLETKPSELLKLGTDALLVALLGAGASFAGGFLLARAVGLAVAPSLLVAVAIVSTSVGVTARVLKDMGLLGRVDAKLVLAAAVIDDMLGPLVLSIVLAVAGGGATSPAKLGVVFAEIAVFVVFEVWVAPRLVARHAHLVEGLRTPNAPFVVAIAIMLGTAALAEWVGLAAVVGAFLAGMMLAETEDRFCVSRDTRPLYDWLVPYFFAVTGMHVQLSLFADPRVLGLGVALTLVAVLAKVVGCGLGAIGHGWRRALAVGVGMIPRAEIGLIVASVGRTANVIDAPTYAVILFAMVATMVIAPLVTKPAFQLSTRVGEGRT